MTIHPAERIRKAFREFVASNQGGKRSLHHAPKTMAESHGSVDDGSRNDDSIDGELMLETTLVRDGMYCGRRFALDGFNLVYFAEEQQVKLYNPAGNIERRCSLLDFYKDFLREDHDARRAA